MKRDSSENRCTLRKHVQEKTAAFCDCGAFMVVTTASKNAYVVTVIDSVQREVLDRIEAAS